MDAGVVVTSGGTASTKNNPLSLRNAIATWLHVSLRWDFGTATPCFCNHEIVANPVSNMALSRADDGSRGGRTKHRSPVMKEAGAQADSGLRDEDVANKRQKNAKRASMGIVTVTMRTSSLTQTRRRSGPPCPNEC